MARNHPKREFAIIGLDSFGENLALALLEQDHEVLGIDRDPVIVQQLSDNLQNVVAVDATDEEVLTALGIDAFETVVVAIGGNLAQAVLVTLALKELGVRRVVCEAQSEHDRRVLLRVGADEIVTPAIESARAIANSLTDHKAQTSALRLSDQLAIKWRPPRAFEGPLGELMGDHPEVQVLLLAGRSIVYYPGPEEPVSRGSELLVAGPEAAILSLQEGAGSGD